VTVASSSAIETTTVTGTVLGLDGQGLAGVTITVSSADLASTMTATSGAGGAFAVAGLQVGTSQVGAEAVVTIGGVILYGTSGGVAPVAGGATVLQVIHCSRIPTPARTR
jgi:hypothetical protein